jgi:hypothetical protein
METFAGPAAPAALDSDSLDDAELTGAWEVEPPAGAVELPL